MQPYTEINRQKSADKINDPVASGEAQAGRAVGAAGGCGKMNTTWRIAGQPPKSGEIFTILLEIFIVLSGVLTIGTAGVTRCFLLAQRSRHAPDPCPTRELCSPNLRVHVVAMHPERCTT